MLEISPGSTSQSVYFLLRDTTTNQGKTGLVYNSAGAQAAYTRRNGSATAITLATLASPTASYSSGGFVEVDATNAPGVYRLDVPDAALASGVSYVMFHIGFSATFTEGLMVLLRQSSSNLGAGSIAHTVTVTNQNTSLPVANAEVWVTTDSAGTNVVAGTLVTDMNGQVTFYLDAGSYYLWCTEPGFTRTNPTAFTVS